MDLAVMIRPSIQGTNRMHYHIASCSSKLINRKCCTELLMEGHIEPYTLQSPRLLLCNFWWYMNVTFNGTQEEHGRMVHFVCNKWNEMSDLYPQKKWSFVRDDGGNMGEIHKKNLTSTWITSDYRNRQLVPVMPNMRTDIHLHVYNHLTTSTTDNLNKITHKRWYIMSTNNHYSLWHKSSFDY